MNFGLLIRTIAAMALLFIMTQPLQTGGGNQLDRIRAKEQRMADSVNIDYSDAETFYFEISPGFPNGNNNQNNVIKGKSDYFIEVPHRQSVKILVKVFWRKDTTYYLPELDLSEKVEIKVYENKTNIVVDHRFYMVNGVDFVAEKNTEYFVRFRNLGFIPKAITFAVSKSVLEEEEVSLNKGKESGVSSPVKGESRTLKILKQLWAFVRMIERNRIFSKRISEKVLNLSNQYMGFEIFEALVLFGIVIYQVGCLRKMTARSSVI